MRAEGFSVMPINLPETFIDLLTYSSALSAATAQNATFSFLFTT